MKWVFKVMTTVHIFLYRVSNGRIGSFMNGADILLLTTTGRKSGKKRTSPLGYFDFKGDGSYLVVASAGGSDQNPGWFFNLERNPQVTVQVKDKKIKAQAQVVSPEERQMLWDELLKIAPPFYAEYQSKTTREMPLILLYPGR